MLNRAEIYGAATYDCTHYLEVIDLERSLLTITFRHNAFIDTPRD